MFSKTTFKFTMYLLPLGQPYHRKEIAQLDSAENDPRGSYKERLTHWSVLIKTKSKNQLRWVRSIR